MTQPVSSTANLNDLQNGKAEKTWPLLKRLIVSYLLPYKKMFVGAMLFMALAAAMRGVFTHTIQLVFDGMVRRNGLAYMAELSAFIVGIFVVRGASVYMHTLFMNRVGQRIVANVQQEMCDHLLVSDLAFFHNNPSGTLVSRVTNDVAIMRQSVNECLLNSFRGSLELMSLIAVMFYQNWRLSCFVFLIFPISGYYVSRMGKRIRKISSNTQNATGTLAAHLNQIFQGTRHVKAYGNEKLEVARVRAHTEEIYRLSLKAVRISAITNPVMEVFSALAVVLLILYGYELVARGSSSEGDIVAFVTAFLLAYDPMKRLGRVNAQLQAGLAAAERVFSLLDIQPTIKDAPDAQPLTVPSYGVAFDHVDFFYADGTQALADLSITVPHGKTAAIVGSSGAGKSTVINLIPRFYDVQGGRVTIGGTDVRTVTLASLRGHISLVSQETALFDDTIRANIAYGKLNATQAEIEQAARDAFADAFIRELPQGYDTHVGELGVKLSGGQRQRIAIARAMLRNAPVLLLDEATSALDNESERAVQDALKRLQTGRTTIVVAHRLSTIVDADIIVVLDKGRVAEQGTHAELMSRNGAYARLYGLQART